MYFIQGVFLLIVVTTTHNSYAEEIKNATATHIDQMEKIIANHENNDDIGNNATNRSSYIDYMENKAKNNNSIKNEVAIFQVNVTDNLGKEMQKFVDNDKESK